jgi:hypothetical protein
MAAKFPQPVKGPMRPKTTKSPTKVKPPSTPTAPTPPPTIKRFDNANTNMTDGNATDHEGTDGRPLISQEEGGEMLGFARWTMAAQIVTDETTQTTEEARIRELVGKTERYAICALDPDLIAVIDQRYMLDGPLAWPELRPLEDCGLTDEDCGLTDFEDLLCALSAGPTLNEADESMFAWLEASAGAWDDAGLDADPPDDAVAARHGRLCQNSVVFKGSMAEAERFLRGMVEYSRRH